MDRKQDKYSADSIIKRINDEVANRPVFAVIYKPEDEAEANANLKHYNIDNDIVTRVTEYSELRDLKIGHYIIISIPDDIFKRIKNSAYNIHQYIEKYHSVKPKKK